MVENAYDAVQVAVQVAWILWKKFGEKNLLEFFFTKLIETYQVDLHK